jgi:TPP-dependent pyruvate/acetoin dehydrogenase alpha subunit
MAEFRKVTELQKVWVVLCIFSQEHRFMAVTVVGGSNTGRWLAFADKYFETGGVTMTYFGDGAARQGSLHEAFNMAMLWKFLLFLLWKMVTLWEHQ